MTRQQLNAEAFERARRIKLLLMDCDGVMTDGRLYFSAEGEALKVFNVRDGQGLVNWHRAGFISGIITGRKSKILELRASELGIRYLRQNAADKIVAFEEILSQSGLSRDETAFIGDDIIDLELMREVGFSFSVADADESLFEVADYVTAAKGGCGAVREIVDPLLRVRQRS